MQRTIKLASWYEDGYIKYWQALPMLECPNPHNVTESYYYDGRRGGIKCSAQLVGWMVLACAKFTSYHSPASGDDH